jgi:methyl-accepting chemotaxis protein
LGQIVRRQFYVHKIQRKNLLFGAILLLAYTIILIVSMLLSPASAPMSNAPLAAEKEVTDQFIALVSRFWPAFSISFILSLTLGLFLTHRLAGPLYRFEQTIKAILSGDLSVRIRLREKDEFQELALLLNQAVVEIEQRLRAIETKGHQLQERLDVVLAELEQQPQGQVIAQELEPVQNLHNELMVLIKRFQLSSPPPDFARLEGLRPRSEHPDDR